MTVHQVEAAAVDLVADMTNFLKTSFDRAGDATKVVYERAGEGALKRLTGFSAKFKQAIRCIERESEEERLAIE